MQAVENNAFQQPAKFYPFLSPHSGFVAHLLTRYDCYAFPSVLLLKTCLMYATSIADPAARLLTVKSMPLVGGLLTGCLTFVPE